MSGHKCRNCGSTNIETDPARGDAVCTECGFVLEDQLIVSETTFEEAPAGNMMVLGQFVSSDSTGGATGFGAAYHVQGKESREITIQNAKKGITHLCQQLHLNQHCIDTSVNFYKMAISRNLTRGRKREHNHAACVYITCRTEGTPHLLIDISDVLQICVYELGRTYLRFTQALCISVPSMDPCLFILRFANKMEFEKKTHDVSMTALRLVQRMKRDSIHSGRRPSGLCGAALLMAARLHEFNRTPADIVKIVKVRESTLRKRLMEFGDTPSSALTLDEFMTVDLEEEQDPPAFKAARKKDRERMQKLENVDAEFNELQHEIEQQLEDQKNQRKRNRPKDLETIEDTEPTEETRDTEKFIKVSNFNVIDNYVGGADIDDGDDPDDPVPLRLASVGSHPMISGLGPDIASIGLGSKDKDSNAADKVVDPFQNESGALDITDLDDEELDSYIMSEKEASAKDSLWKVINATYLEEQKVREEKAQDVKDEGKPEKKKRRTNVKKNRNQNAASTAGEAIEKMLQEKRISTKINYEVLRSLNVPPPKNLQSLTNDETRRGDEKSETDDKTKTEIGNETDSNKRIATSRKSKITKSPEKSSGVSLSSKNIADESVDHGLDAEASDAAVDDDEMADDDVELNPSEMTVGQMLGQEMDDDGYGYGYDDEDY